MKKLDFKIGRAALLRRYGSTIKANEKFRDRHAGQRCFVIGNGPSLKYQDLSPLAGEITMATNSFHLHPIISKAWQPSYYFLSDPAYFESANLSEYPQLTDKIDSAPFFVPHYASDFLNANKVLPRERTYFVAVWGGPEKENWRHQPNLAEVIPGAQTVVQLAIMAAIYMGCSPIYLLGVDHDWLSHGGEHLNFYSETDAASQPAGSVAGWEYRPLMESVLLMWQIYEALEKSSRAAGMRIINATCGGFLDVFERGCYEEIVAPGPAASTERVCNLSGDQPYGS